MTPEKKIVFSLEDQHKIAVTRVEELARRLEALRKAVENCKDELISWNARANTLGEVIKSQMEGGTDPQPVRGEGASTDSDAKGE